MKTFNRKTGTFAEEKAVLYLRQNGFRILECNFQNKFGELDIIVEKDGILVFVEVKAKIGDDFGSPEEMVGKGKLQRVRNMATVYMNGENRRCRIDVIAVVLNTDKSVRRLTHYENVY